eukprot:4770130-Alexandrium_andersonii.AAC.1
MKVAIFVAVVQSRMLYSLGCTVLPQRLALRLEARQVSMLRMALKIPTTWGAIKMGVDPISNKK